MNSNCQIGGGGGGVTTNSNGARAVKAKAIRRAKARAVVRKRKPARRSCRDVPPGGGYSCSEQKAWGKCGQSWMTRKSSQLPKGYCAHTCGRC